MHDTYLSQASQTVPMENFCHMEQISYQKYIYYEPSLNHEHGVTQQYVSFYTLTVHNFAHLVCSTHWFYVHNLHIVKQINLQVWLQNSLVGIHSFVWRKFEIRQYQVWICKYQILWFSFLPSRHYVPGMWEALNALKSILCQHIWYFNPVNGHQRMGWYFSQEHNGFSQDIRFVTFGKPTLKISLYISPCWSPNFYFYLST